MAKEKKTQRQIEKEERLHILREECQKLCDKGRISMGDFMKNWNAKNKDKITEMVKLDHTILIRFGNYSVHCFTDNLYL